MVDITCSVCGAPLDKSVAGALEHESEIEITPEMIEAGLKELLAYDSRWEQPEDAIISIYNAMIKAGRVVAG